MHEKFRIGDFFLDRRPNSPNWCACRFDTVSRQTRRASLGTSDIQEAKIRLAEYVTRHQSFTNLDPDNLPVEVVLVRYWEKHAQKLPSAEQAKHAMALWSDLLPGITVAELTPARQRPFIADLQAKGYKASYVSRVLSVGRAALRLAWKEGELASVPFIMDVERDLEQEAERFRILEMEEMALLLSQSINTPHLLMFNMISLNTLARPDAVLDLGPGQVDIRRRRIKLNPEGRKQTKKYRPVVPIADTLLPLLNSCVGARYVLYQGKPVADIGRAFKSAADRAGVTNVSPYCLRHTMATELRARDVPEWEVMGMLGHKSRARTTERYAAYRPDYLGRATKAIDDYIHDLRQQFGHLLPHPIFNPMRARRVLVPQPGLPENLGKDGGRYWDRTSDPYDVKVAS